MKRLTRSLPYPVDIDAERIFLSSYLTGSFKIEGYYDLTCKDLFVSEHRMIFYAILELNVFQLSRDELIKQLEQTGKMSSAVSSALKEIPDEPISTEILVKAIKRIIDFSICRSLINRLENTTRWLADGDIDSEKFLQWTHDAIVELKGNDDFLPL